MNKEDSLRLQLLRDRISRLIAEWDYEAEHTKQPWVKRLRAYSAKRLKVLLEEVETEAVRLEKIWGAVK